MRHRACPALQRERDTGAPGAGRLCSGQGSKVSPGGRAAQLTTEKESVALGTWRSSRPQSLHHKTGDQSSPITEDRGPRDLSQVQPRFTCHPARSSRP